MKLTVDFPSVAYREGSEAMIQLAQAIERIGFDELDMFDHVVMGHPMEGRADAIYPATMPIMEALMMLSFFSAVTKTIGLGTEILVLPQRQPTLVAKQISTLDTLSNGRVRLGVGVGWQASEYEALGEKFTNRGARMDQAIALLRACWQEESISVDSPHYQMQAMGMEPKPPQGGALPIWIGGHSEAALRRVGRLADGWMGARLNDAETTKKELEIIKKSAEETGRDPESIQLQMMLAPPPRGQDSSAKMFYTDMDRVAARLVEIQSLGFGWATINMTNLFQSGARSVAAMIDALGGLHERLRREVD